MMQRGIAVRLFFTCWILYSLHFATNVVREIYLAVSLGDHFTFRVDEYTGLHPDLFEKPGFGWHINNNPGASMFASIPYAMNRFWIDAIAEKIKEGRNANRVSAPPQYDSPWPLARQFYAEVWKRGLDVKLGLAAMVMQVFCMAPLSAAGVVLMFFVLSRIFRSPRTGLWLSLLYAFGTPIFFRTGSLNQNLITAHAAFAGFALLWNGGSHATADKADRWFLPAGLMGGICILLDYSGIVLFALILSYGLSKYSGRRLQNVARYLIGALFPLGLLWLYQWKSFGHPFYPPQYHMPAINPWVETGFRGLVIPRADLLWALLFDYRYGLFASCPLLLLAPFVFLLKSGRVAELKKELWFSFLFFICLWIFFGGVNYTNLQFNTGIRYLVAIVPFLFIPVAMVLLALPRTAAIVLSALSVLHAWCMAMYRDVERGSGVLEPVIRIFSEGLQLPALTTMKRMEGLNQYLPFGGSAYPVFALAALILFFIWRFREAPVANVPAK